MENAMKTKTVHEHFDINGVEIKYTHTTQTRMASRASDRAKIKQNIHFSSHIPAHFGTTYNKSQLWATGTLVFDQGLAMLAPFLCLKIVNPRLKDISIVPLNLCQIYNN